MSFLHPLALVLGTLAAVPIVLHLRRGGTRRRVAFPAIRYLRRVEREHARAVRLSDLVLLALRVLLVLVIAAAAAGPLVGEGDASDHRPTDVAILIDNTASTARPAGSGTALDVLKARAAGALSAALPEDRFWVFGAVGEPLARDVAAAEAARAVARVQPTDGSGDILAVVESALVLLPEREGRAREVHLLTDLQASGFGGAPPGSAPGVPVVVGVARPDAAPGSPEPASNGAIASAQLSTGPDVPAGHGADVAVELRRWPQAAGAAAGGDARGPGEIASEPTGATGATEDSARAVELRLLVDGRMRAVRAAAWGTETLMPLPPLPPGPHHARVEIPPDGLRADDAYDLAFEVLPPPLVEYRGPAGSFLALALASLREAGRVASPRSAAPARVHVLEGGGPGAAPTGRAAEALVLIPPADPLDLARFNQVAAAAGVPLVWSADAGSGQVGIRGELRVPGLDRVQVARAYELRLPGGASVPLRTTDGRPWLVAGETDGLRWLALGSPLVPDATDLPVEPAMIPFVETLILRAAGDRDAGTPANAIAGAPLVWPPRVDSVRPPDGPAFPVEGGAPGRPLQAGVYRIHEGGAVTYLAANVPSAESDLRSLSPEDLASRLPKRPLVLAGEESGGWLAAVFRSRRGADAAPWLLALALVLALIEAWVAAPGRRREEAKARNAARAEEPLLQSIS